MEISKKDDIKTKKICFVSLAAYSYLVLENTGTAGGAELQQILLANDLKIRGYDVSFVVQDYGQKSIEEIGGIKIFKKYPFNAPLGIRLYELRSVWVALKQANSDIYCCRGFGRNTVFTALFCLLKNKKFIWSIAHDMDVDGRRLKSAKFYGSLAFKFAVKSADCVIAQSLHQQELLKKNFGRDSVIIKSMHIVPGGITEKANPPIALWVSRMQDWKQPEVFIRLAKEISDVKFQMIGGESESKEFYEQIKVSASKIPNLEFVGFVPYPEINMYFERASIFVNTSTAEGFPNTFLQAWARYTPVVSLNVDPDGIIGKHKLGFYSGSFEQMVEDVKLLLKEEKLREEMGMNGRKYVEKAHDIRKIIKTYELIFECLVRRTRYDKG